MTISFEYDDEAAGKADNVTSRIDTSDAFIGRFISVNAMKSREKGTNGLHFEFEASNGGGTASFDLYTSKADGEAVFGVNLVNAIMAIMELRSLKSVEGKYEGFVDGKRQDVEGDIFPELTKKDIGVVLQKELYTKQDGGDSYRMQLYGVFHPVSKLTATEIKEHKTKPEKLEKMLRGLKTKDKRVSRPQEPAQPGMGADSAGNY